MFFMSPFLRKKKITSYIKKVWPDEPPKFRGNLENSRKLEEVVDFLSTSQKQRLKKKANQKNGLGETERKYF